MLSLGPWHGRPLVGNSKQSCRRVPEQDRQQGGHQTAVKLENTSKAIPDLPQECFPDPGSKIYRETLLLPGSVRFYSSAHRVLVGICATVGVQPASCSFLDLLLVFALSIADPTVSLGRNRMSRLREKRTHRFIFQWDLQRPFFLAPGRTSWPEQL